MSNYTIERLDAAEAARAVPDLAEVLFDCVEGGASVSFMWPFSRGKAAEFWHGVAAKVARGESILLAARDAEGICGTVHLSTAVPENQPHRADVTKMLVHRRARRRGVGEALLSAVEEAAAEAGRTLLVLDTVTGGDAERLYSRAGWTVCGVIPDYALFPDGRPCSTTVFYKRVATA
jgi:GNAT superfamily N-acetyltransferase